MGNLPAGFQFRTEFGMDREEANSQGILAKSYYAAISSWSFKPYPYIHITNRLDHQKLIYPVKVVSFSQEF